MWLIGAILFVVLFASTYPAIKQREEQYRKENERKNKDE